MPQEARKVLVLEIDFGQVGHPPEVSEAVAYVGSGNTSTSSVLEDLSRALRGRPSGLKVKWKQVKT